MTDSVSFDLLYGGNRQAIQSGTYYYSFNGSSSAIPNESTQTLAAITQLKSLMLSVITNTSITASPGNTLTQITDNYLFTRLFIMLMIMHTYRFSLHNVSY